MLCDFPLVINTNLPHTLHRFRDIAFDKSKIAIFAFNPRELTFAKFPAKLIVSLYGMISCIYTDCYYVGININSSSSLVVVRGHFSNAYLLFYSLLVGLEPASE